MDGATVWDKTPRELMSPMCPEPGVYHGIAFTDYVAWDAINHSRLDLLRRSPEHYRHGGGVISRALEFGQLCHTGILEPTQLSERYAVLPTFELDAENVSGRGDAAKPSKSKSTAYYREQKEQFLAEQRERGRLVIDRPTYDDFEAMVKALERNARAVSWLSGTAQMREVSIVWHDRQKGKRCKARIDCVGDGALIDLKTTQDPEPRRKFPKQIFDYGYHRQGAWYVDGWNTLHADGLHDYGPVTEFRIVAIGKESPRQCVAAPIDSESIELGRCENADLMAELMFWQERGEWPGYENPEDWGVPEWARETVLSGGIEA